MFVSVRPHINIVCPLSFDFVKAEDMRTQLILNVANATVSFHIQSLDSETLTNTIRGGKRWPPARSQRPSLRPNSFEA